MRLFPALPPVPEVPDPAARDLALDVLRAWSLLVVVLGHFLMLILMWDGDVPTSGNTLTSGEPWPYVTWLLQVMPLFFIAGGAVNQRSFERFDGSYNQWLWQRTRRLMRPTVVFLLAMVVVFVLVTLLVPRETTDPLVQGITGPLWFLAVYIPVTALTPLTSRWWRSAGLNSVVILALVAALVDVARLHWIETGGALNMVVAWTLVHQLGYWYRRGITRAQGWALVLGGLAANVLLSQVLGWYPTSLVGIPTERFSNMAPPTIVLVLHSSVLLGLFVLLAPWMRRRFATPRAFAATTRAALFAMTIYLWHMAVLVGWLSLLHLLALDLPVRVEGGNVVPEGLHYWGWLLPSTLGYALVLFCVVRWLWPLEFVRLPWFDSAAGAPSASVVRAGLGAVLVGSGLLAVAGGGFSGFPAAVHTAYGIPVSTAGALVALGVGLALLRQPLPARRTADLVAADSS